MFRIKFSLPKIERLRISSHLKVHNVGSNFGQKIEKEYENLIYIFVSFVILFCVMDN
jgi:hypothetical protein